MRALVSIIEVTEGHPLRALWGNSYSFINPKLVWQYVAEKKFETEPYRALPHWDLDVHHRRIAYLLANGWKDYPIVSIGDSGSITIKNGNHRIIAAHIRGQELIEVDMVGYVEAYIGFVHVVNPGNVDK